MSENFFEQAQEILPRLSAWRRHLHQHPELGFEEHATQAYLIDELRDMGHRPRPLGGTGVVCDIGQGAPVVMLRADIDGLPLQETSEASYKSSVPGVMHACGHDGHTAILLGVARLLADQPNIPGTLRLAFQPAEERHPGGALNLIRDGVLDGVSRVIGLHLQSLLPAGQAGARVGIQSANSDRFRIVVEGRGGHASAPHLVLDPVPVAAELVTALQTIVSRRVDPFATAVVTVGAIHAGTTFNVIPDRAEILGTVRTLEAGVQDLVEARMKTLVAQVCAAHEMEGRLEYMRGYPSVVNTEAETAVLRQQVETIMGSAAWVDLPLRTGGEDFSYYLRERPGVFWRLGAEIPGRRVPHHNGGFDFNEDVMPAGVAVSLATAVEFLKLG